MSKFVSSFKKGPKEQKFQGGNRNSTLYETGFISKKLGHMISVDMDGTVADISARRLLALKSGPDGSPAFFNTLLDGALYHMDEPIIASRDFLQTYVSGNHGRVVYLSGRRQGSEKYSRDWLKVHGFPTGEIIHRRMGERSLNFKANWLRRFKSENEFVDAHFGDRLEDDGGAAETAGVSFVHIVDNRWPSFSDWSPM